MTENTPGANSPAPLTPPEDVAPAAAKAAPEPGPGSGPVASSTAVSAHFKMIFLSVLGLSTALLAIRIGVSICVTAPTDDLKEALSTCNQLGIAGFGAILGLIGGKIS